MQRLGRAVAVERVGRGVVHKVEDLLFIEEFHDRLGGVDVHVHHVRRQRDVQHAAGEFALHQAVCVGFLHRSGEKLGFDEAAVDEKGLHPSRAAAREGLGHKAVNGELTVAPVDLDQREGKIAAQRGVDGAEGLAVAGGVQLLPAVLDETEGNIGVRERDVRGKARNGGRLGAVLLHELQPRGRVVKKVAHDDARALGTARGLDGERLAAVEMQRRAARGARLTRENIQVRNGRDGGERFAAEAERADGGQIGGGAELARRVAQKGGGQLVGRDAAAVVRDAQIGQPAVLQLDGDVPRARVDGVFQKLLDNARGTLDDLAGGNEIGDMGG